MAKHYHRDGKVRGVLLRNVWRQVDAARGLIASNQRLRPEELNQQLLCAA